LTQTSLKHFDAAEWAPSTASKAEKLDLSIRGPLYPTQRTFDWRSGPPHLSEQTRFSAAERIQAAHVDAAGARE